MSSHLLITCLEVTDINYFYKLWLIAQRFVPPFEFSINLLKQWIYIHALVMSKIHQEKNDLYFKYLELEYYTHQIIESKKKKFISCSQIKQIQNKCPRVSSRNNFNLEVILTYTNIELRFESLLMWGIHTFLMSFKVLFREKW